MFGVFCFLIQGLEGSSSRTCMRVTKRTAMHNIFDSACLKGYSFLFKIRSVHRCKRTEEEAVRLDVLQRVCLSFKFCFLSVTVRDNMDKNRRSTTYIIRTEEQRSDQQPGMFGVFWHGSGTQSAELHLLAKAGQNNLFF